MELPALAGMLILIGCFIGLIALIAAPVVLALFVVAVILKVVLFVVFLPFRLIAGLFGLGLTAVGWVVRGVLLFAGLGFLLLVGLLPLLPFLLIAGGVYLVFRAMRPRSVPVAHV